MFAYFIHTCSRIQCSLSARYKGHPFTSPESNDLEWSHLPEPRTKNDVSICNNARPAAAPPNVDRAPHGPRQISVST